MQIKHKGADKFLFPHYQQSAMQGYTLAYPELYPRVKVKSCYNPLRLGTVIVLVSSGIDFVNTPGLYSDRATR